MTTRITLVFSFFVWQLVLLLAARLTTAASGGKWHVLQPNIGISAMHMQLLNNNKVVVYDRTGGRSNLTLHTCPKNQGDCTAHSVEYDVSKNSVRPLHVRTDFWCSSGAVMPDGQLVQTGGNGDGDHVVRVFKPCKGCDWEEIMHGLTQTRWYATSHILPDGREIIIGGRDQLNYEFYPKTGSTKSYELPFLAQTKDQIRGGPNNWYPFVFLNVDGNLFIFANNRAILFDYVKGVVVRSYPVLEKFEPRNYPSTGSAVLLPLKNLQGRKVEAEVLVCGGAPKGAFLMAQSRNSKFVQALDTCGRLKITDPAPQWIVEKMPLPRVMGDMLLLPTGDVLIINGGSHGTAAWELGRNPVLNPASYQPDNQIGSRFEEQNPTTIPRMYHSTAILLGDGRILVGGSNPHDKYNFTTTLFPTELSLEAFSPSYLDPEFTYLRPTIMSPTSQAKIGYGQQIRIRFSVSGQVNRDLIKITMVAPAFNTHSFSMNQRLLVLGSGNVTVVGLHNYEIMVATPNSGTLAPSGFYMLFVVYLDIPSEAIWVQIQ